MNKSVKMILLVVGITVLVASGGPVQAEPAASSADAASVQQPVPYDLVANTPDPDGFIAVTVGEYFTCDIPSDWGRTDGQMFGLSDEEKKTYGIELQAPYWGEIPARISVCYYAEGNLLYRSVDHYLRVFAHPALGVALEGSGYGAIAPAIVSGREGMIFERVKNEYLPLNNIIGPVDKQGKDDPKVYERREMMARPVPIRERFVVLPAKSGFYALRYTASEETFRDHLRIFEKVAATFHAMQ
jgi:hypothetical protein